VLRAILGFARRSRKPRQPAETAREYLERHDVMPELAEALEALEALETECYGPGDPVPVRTSRAVQLFAGSQPGVTPRPARGRD